MKKTTSNKLNMYRNIHAVLTKHQSAWETVPAFAAAVTTFNGRLDLLQIRLVEQDTATDGVGAKKQKQLAELREQMLIVHNALRLYGKAAGNHALEERNKMTKSDIGRLNISKLTVQCGELKQDLDTFGAELVSYGITGEMIAELTPVLENIDELNISTRQAILSRKSVTKSIKDLEVSLDSLLRDELDDLLLVFKTSQSEFFNAFKSARMIIDYGHKGKSGDDPGQNNGSAV